MTDEETLRDALASEYDDYTIGERLRSGDRNTVYEGFVDGRRVACKLTRTQPAVLDRERAVLAAVGARTPVPVPSVRAAGHGYLVLDWAAGDGYERADARNRRRERLRAVGRTLGRLHHSTEEWFSGHGPVTGENDRLAVSDPRDWATRFEAFVDDWAGEIADTPAGDVGAAVRTVVDSHRDAFADRPPVLVHGEPAPDHVRFDGSRVRFVLDWELSQAAPGAFDLAWAERDFLRTPRGATVSAALRDALHAGYESERSLSGDAAFRLHVYRAAFAMRDLRLVTDAEHAARPIADRRATLRAYVSDRLDDARAIRGA